MKRRLYDTVQVWGPGAIALVSLLASISYGLGQERKIGRLEGRVYAVEREHAESIYSFHQKMETVQAYVNSLEKTILKSGINTKEK